MKTLAIITGILTAILGCCAIAMPLRVFLGIGWLLGAFILINGISGTITAFLRKKDVWDGVLNILVAICGGIMVAEIQQSSDITYRIFDWNRVDSEGKSRELHTALAVDAIDFESGVEECRRTYAPEANKEVNIVDCDFFKTDMLVVDGVAELDYCKRDSFTIYMCIEGDAKVTLDGETSETLRTGVEAKENSTNGEVMLIPAIANEVVIEGKAQILASHL